LVEQAVRAANDRIDEFPLALDRRRSLKG